MTAPLPQQLPDGRVAHVLALSHGALRVRITDLGATILSLSAPDRHGVVANVLVGPDTPAAHPAGGGPGPYAYMNATCGRVANRVAGSTMPLDGATIALAANEGRHQLHGGPHGFDRAIWRIDGADARQATLSHVSPDGDQGYPGALTATATFTLEDARTLSIRYTARTTRATHVNLVSHLYFNLSGMAGATIHDHRLRIAADAVLPIDAAGIPLGTLAPVQGTPFDFRTLRRVGDGLDGDDPAIVAQHGYNHNFCLSPPRDALLVDPYSGRRMWLSTDQPGIQLYTGNALCDGYRPHAALCLETQGWPDALHHAHFPSTRLDPGDLYRSETLLRFDTA
ncbi:MAG: aldose epimerase family protein [Pseudomonadota bacterium]|jgi:aldose 1-epimerase|nr:aldose epimerase family protein [Sphingomonas ginsenosidimutans]MEE2915511.1 aldose epimerase family protein [Pseudomonadota bacterium]